MLRPRCVSGKRRETERRKGKRTAPNPESIQKDLDRMAESVRNLQTEVDALIKRPNVLPWRRSDTDPDKERG